MSPPARPQVVASEEGAVTGNTSRDTPRDSRDSRDREHSPLLTPHLPAGPMVSGHCHGQLLATVSGGLPGRGGHFVQRPPAEAGQ